MCISSSCMFKVRDDIDTCACSFFAQGNGTRSGTLGTRFENWSKKLEKTVGYVSCLEPLKKRVAAYSAKDRDRFDKEE
jgi:hypothetical protein